MLNATQQRERRLPALTYHIIYVKRRTSTLHFIEIFVLFCSVCVINVYLIYGIDMSSKRCDIPWKNNKSTIRTLTKIRNKDWRVFEPGQGSFP